MNILIVIAVLIFIALAIFKLEWALFITLILLPSYLIRFKIGPIPTTFLEIMILTVFITWFIKNKPWLRLKKNAWQKRSKKYPYYLEISAILIIAWIGLAIAEFNFSSLGIFKAYFLEPIMLYLVIINYGKGSEKKFIWPLVISALLISIFAIYQQITGSFIINPFWAALETRRVTSVFPYPNALGLYLAPIFFLTFSLFYSYPKHSNLLVASKKILLILTAIGSILAIFFARSEGALIGILGAVFIVAFLANKKSHKLAIGLFVLIIIGLISHPPAWDYTKKKLTLMDLSGQIRRQQWSETMTMLNDGRLITGAGLNNYQIAVAPFHQDGIFVKNDDPEWHRHVVWNEEYRKKMWQPVEIYLYPHNIFLNFWSEIGLFGALLFTWLIIRYFYDSIKLLKINDKKKKNLILGLIGAMSALVIHGLVDVPYFKNDLAILFWLLIALIGIIKLKQKEKI
ncbi:MAG: hypothetical protein EOM88_01770 [Clostridia bacterium]|nr:hypothetical protein [Clostridia bacterium]